MQPGDLFVALHGDRFDGHAFLDEAAKKGVLGALVERSGLPATLPPYGVIAVDNTRAALGRLAACYRSEFAIPLIAVAGSNGKTTTKDLLATVLRERFKTLSSAASYNNDIGVPTTLLELDRGHQVAVLEFGTNHPGELAPLLQLARPRYGVLTSLGREHLEFFKDLQGVVREEGWIAEVLPPDGRLFVNGDAEGIAEVIRRSSAPVTRVGFGPENQWRASEARMDEGGMHFRVGADHPGFCRSFRLPLLGRHQVGNALLVIALAAEMGLNPEEVQSGLEKCRPSKMRLQPWHWGEVLVLDDSYNANADSMRAALETLRDFPCQARRIAVLGDMAELGTHAAEAHVEVARCAAAAGVDVLLSVGERSGVTGAAARQAGVPVVEECMEVEAAAKTLRRLLQPHDVLLLKASRAAGLDRIGMLLREGPGPANQEIGQPPKRRGRD